MDLFWLPEYTGWNEALKVARTLDTAEAAQQMQTLANARIDFLQTLQLDRVLQKRQEKLWPYLQRTAPIRLAVLGSSTLAHLAPSLRVAALRRGFTVEIFEGHYGMYYQELADSNSALYAFKPQVVLLALDAHHVTAGDSPSAAATLETLKACWKMICENLGATVLQQTVLPVFPALLGNNEHLLAGSRRSIIREVNCQLRQAAKAANINLLAVDDLAEAHGVRNLYDEALWHRSKQEIHPKAGPLWGDHVARLLAALRGLSYKCLVLDLDNTLWGGVIGDDGLDGILLGQGNASGEAYVAFQRYAAELAGRGIILAVCSKNDEDVAKSVFEKHPEMVLRIKDIACFVANWQDKATNLRHIAKSLNIGIDSLVFVDDNPFERNLVRQELPAVAVPEMPEDPAFYAETVASGGYFESLSFTLEDRERNQQYQANLERDHLRNSATDMSRYLQGLKMELVWAPFDTVGLSRIAQLINKSNQYNLTTRRYTQDELKAMMADRSILTLQLRLLDKFGDNGMIAVVIGRMGETQSMRIDTWLMSCRVLGRQVEDATLNLIMEQAEAHGIQELIGEYLPTEKNGMVKNHYLKFGFTEVSMTGNGASKWQLDLKTYPPRPTFIQSKRGNQ